jgi:hypothetical protein
MWWQDGFTAIMRHALFTYRKVAKLASRQNSQGTDVSEIMRFARQRL